MTTRVLAYRPEYLVMWNIGAGMVLFTREAARIVLATYAVEHAARLGRFYKRRFGADLSDVWELWFGKRDRELSPDWAFSKHLYKHGLISLGTVPCLARNMDMDIEKEFRSSYVLTNPGTCAEDDLVNSRLKDFTLRGWRATDRGRRLRFAIDLARGRVFRAQLHNKGVRDVVYFAKHMAHPRSSARALYRRIKKRISRAGS